ncbi:MAG TPA: hypothetical protein VF212_11115 [Longimicrobiales bacterium]
MKSVVIAALAPPVRAVRAAVAALAALAVLAVVAGCSAFEPDDELATVSGPTPFQRALAAPPDRVVAAAADVLRDLGLPLEAPYAAATVVTATVTLHERWQGRPVHARLLCGVPFLHMGDREVGGWIPYTDGNDDEYERAVAYTARLPIELRMGFQAEPTVDGSTVTLLMAATGQIASASPLGPREVACLPTKAFVDELFAGIEARLGDGEPVAP